MKLSSNSVQLKSTVVSVLVDCDGWLCDLWLCAEDQRECN